jgi:copper/silver efflux system protein
MIKNIISLSLNNRFIIIIATLCLVFGGVFALRNIPIDALPDLSDTQVIIYTPWAGQAPQIVEDQVTYPISTKMVSIPRAKVVRGYSFFGFSFVYVIFQDGTDPYWARSRVLEYLNSLSGKLPKNALPTLGPDATGVGWAFMYALDSKTHSLEELRTIQDWHLKYQLSGVEGVAEVASIGGFVKQYQVSVDPEKLRAYNLSISDVGARIQQSNGEVGGGSLELAEKEFLIRIPGYVRSLDDLKKVAVGVGNNGTPITLNEIGVVQLGPEARRGIGELNGEGEAVGGIVIVRYGANVLQVIEDVKTRLNQVMKSYSPSITSTITYDRTSLIEKSIGTLEKTLIEESIVVGIVCIIFLLHFRSVFVALIILPISVLTAFLIMYVQGITANIMSLGGIAIAIGAMVDAVIIMIENVHKHIEREGGKLPHWEIIKNASLEVGPSLFYSLLVIAISFIPVFTLQAEEGRLFKPLAFTKTYSMAAAAILSITLAPILMGYCIRGKILPEEKNPVNRFLIHAYQRVIHKIIRFRYLVVALAIIITAWVFFPWNYLVTQRLPQGDLKNVASVIGKAFPYQNLGSEFMPPLYEGDLLYMPTTFPGISVTKARELLQQTDKIIKTFPEVKTVFGKIGKAETATDPAPLDMIETTIQLKDEREWPKVHITNASNQIVAFRKRTRQELQDAMNAALQFPGLSNIWTMPIKTRIDMLSTGLKSPVGIKVTGPDLNEIERIATQIEGIIKQVPGTTSAFADRVTEGNYLFLDIDRRAIARYGLTLGDVQDALAMALSGETLATTVQGLERFTINLRYNRDFRNNLEKLAEVLIPTPTGAQIPFGEIGKIKVTKGPMQIKSENSVPTAWIYVDIANTDIGDYLQQAQKTVNDAVSKGAVFLPPGYNIFWSGQYEYMIRAKHQLEIAVPITILLIFLLIYLNTRSTTKTLIILTAIPFSLVGSFWLLYLFGYNLSVAVWVGIIALAGLDAETGVVMLLYLDLAYDEWMKKGQMKSEQDLSDAIYYGAVKRVRPKIMAASVIIMGLLPIIWSQGVGADVMKRIALPMIGGVFTSTLMNLLVYPAIYFIWRKRQL